jgi:hypothetical protein
MVWLHPEHILLGTNADYMLWRLFARHAQVNKATASIPASSNDGRQALQDHVLSWVSDAQRHQQGGGMGGGVVSGHRSSGSPQGQMRLDLGNNIELVVRQK